DPAVIVPKEDEVAVIFELAASEDHHTAFRRVNVRSHGHGKLATIAPAPVGPLAASGHNPPPNRPTESPDAVRLLLSGSVILSRLRLIGLRCGGRRNVTQRIGSLECRNTLPLRRRVDNDRARWLPT